MHRPSYDKTFKAFSILISMLIKSLKLENIRSYTNDVIDFSAGSSLLLGDIGAGKTTVLLGIEFALFGLIKGDVSGTSLLRHGKNVGSVELCFELDGKDVKIARRLKRKNDQISQDAGYIIVDGIRTEATPIELKSKILELFGYPEELLNKNTSLIYRYTVYTPQEDMKAILFESKEERLDTLRKIFNIDKYKRIRENALAYAKELRNMKKIYESKVSDLETKKQELIDKKVSHEKISKDKSEIKKELDEYKQRISSKNGEIKEFEVKISAHNELKKELALADNNLKNKRLENERNNKELSLVSYRINDYETRLKDLGVIDQEEEQVQTALKESEEKLSKINVAKETVNERLKSKEDDLKNVIIEDQASLSAKRINILKNLEDKSVKDKLLDDTKKILDKYALDINALKISKDNSLEVIDQIKNLSTCPICLQTVDFTHKIKITDKENANIIDIERKLSESEKKYSDATNSINQLKKELEQLRLDELELKALEIKLENISSRLELKKQLEKDIEELKTKKDKLDKMDVNKLMETISRNRKIESNIQVRKHIEESLREKKSQKEELDKRTSILSSEIKNLTDKLNEINEKVMSNLDIEKSYNQRRSELEMLNIRLKDVEINYNSINKDQEMINKEIKRLEEEIVLKNKINDKISYIGELNYWMTEHFVSLTSTIEKAIMQKVHREFDELFRKWFDIMMDDENLDVRIDEEFTPIIMQNDYETFIDNLSGGEKTSVALSYRLALNKVINDFINTIKTKDIIILDEPTDGFSSEQLDKMRDVLEELHIGQMIIVSHEMKMESYVENIIRIEKHEHNSKVLT